MMVVMLVEVYGGEEEYSWRRRDEGVAEDDIPVGEVVEEAPGFPLRLGEQEVVNLESKVFESSMSISFTRYPIMNSR